MKKLPANQHQPTNANTEMQERKGNQPTDRITDNPMLRNHRGRAHLINSKGRRRTMVLLRKAERGINQKRNNIRTRLIRIEARRRTIVTKDRIGKKRMTKIEVGHRTKDRTGKKRMTNHQQEQYIKKLINLV